MLWIFPYSLDYYEPIYYYKFSSFWMPLQDQISGHGCSQLRSGLIWRALETRIVVVVTRTMHLEGWKTEARKLQNINVWLLKIRRALRLYICIHIMEILSALMPTLAFDVV